MEEKNSEKKERKMRDSGIPWIGEVPEGWGMSPLKYNYNIIAGATPDSTKQNFWDGNIKWITPADYKTKDVYVSFGKRNLTSAGYKACSTHMLPKGSIVISKRAPIGSVAITTSNLCTNQGCLGLVAKNKFVNNKYFYYVLSIYDDVLNLYGSGTTFKEISANVFSNIEFPLPSVTIQNSIADFLDSKCSEIDTLIENLRARMESAKEYKKAVITEAVTKGLDKDAKMKDSGVEWIGEIPDGWKVVRFKHIASIKSNLVQPDKYMKYPQIAPDNIEKDTGRLLSHQTVEESGIISGNHLFYRGQILYSKIRPNLNKLTVAPFDGLCSADMYPIESKLPIIFMVYSMLSAYFVSQVSLIIQDRVKMPKINQEELGEIKVVVPSQQEMLTIADYLDSKCSEIDALLQNYEDQIATLEEYKKSLIYEYVTGKKEVPVA